MHAKFNYVHSEYYCQVFGNKTFLVETYPMWKKSDCHEAMDKFVKDYGVPESMIYNGVQGKVRPGTKFQANLRKYGIHGHKWERERSNQNPAEGIIWELRKKMVSRNV